MRDRLHKRNHGTTAWYALVHKEKGTQA